MRVYALGTKGDVDHSTVGLHNIAWRRLDLLSYMQQDIYLLSGIMLKAQARSVGVNTT